MTTQTSSNERFLAPIIITILVISLGIPFANWVYKTDRAQKIGAHLNQAKEVRTLLCDDQGTEHKTDLEAEWQEYYNSLALQYSGPVSTLHFEEADAYYEAQCQEAKAYLQYAKDATTDDEKVASFKRVRLLKETVIEVAATLQDAQLASAQLCADSYALAEAKEIEVGRTDPYADQARGFLASGAWDYCAFYAQQSVVVSQQVAICQNNVAVATSYEQALGITNPLADQARQYQQQENWAFCSFYAAQAVKQMQPMLPTATPPP